MSDSFFHGVETISLGSNVGTVNTAKTAVIGLIGTAGAGDVNSLKLCISDTDDAQFGSTGQIPDALKIIRYINNATVLVISLGTGAVAPTAADFIGTVDATSGARTGLKLFDLAFSKFGFRPKILIAPTFSAVAGIASALIACAEKHRGCAYLDSPTAQTVSGAIASRGASGAWNISSGRAKLLYPGVSTSITAAAIQPFSAFAAANRAKVDMDEGFWFSSSNHTILGVEGLETEISFALNDPTCEANALNAAGIVTIANSYGTGFREWGNRNASFPVKSDPSTFESLQRLDDITSEAIELACMPFVDKPMSDAEIDVVTDTVNGYFNTLIGKKALIIGSKCLFEASKNSVTEMAAGHYVWTKDFMGPVPGEKFTFLDKIDINLLNNLL